MKHRTTPAGFGSTLVVTLALAGATAWGGDSRSREDPGVFAGTWINDVKIVACPPALPIVFEEVKTMITLTSDGTAVEGGSSGAPFSSRSPGFGIWRRTSARHLLIYFRFHAFDDQGRLANITEVWSRPRLIHGDNPETPDVVEPYYLKGPGTNRLTFLNPADGSVVNVIEGCNEATSAPVLFPD